MAELARQEDMMLVAEFLQFTQTRPDEEKWELVDGVPVLNAPAVRHHQRIITNLLRRLEALETLHNGFGKPFQELARGCQTIACLSPMS